MDFKITLTKIPLREFIFGCQIETLLSSVEVHWQIQEVTCLMALSTEQYRHLFLLWRHLWRVYLVNYKTKVS